MSPRITLATLAIGLFSKLRVKPSLPSSAGTAPSAAAAGVASAAGSPLPKNEKALGAAPPLGAPSDPWGYRGDRSAFLMASAALGDASSRCSRDVGVHAVSAANTAAKKVPRKTMRERWTP